MLVLDCVIMEGTPLYYNHRPMRLSFASPQYHSADRQYPIWYRHVSILTSLYHRMYYASPDLERVYIILSAVL